jgi:hypothetical protein
MRVRGELRCYHCGYVAAHVEETRDLPGAPFQIIPSPDGPGVRRGVGQPPRCGRCGGPLFVDDIDVVRGHPPRRIAPPAGAHRVRPRRAPVPA